VIVGNTLREKAKLNALPPSLLSAGDYESLAAEFIDAPTLAWIAGGSGDEWTLQENRAAFARVRLQPRLLTDYRQGHTTCRLLGQTHAHPFLLAPVACQKLVHPRGELETVRGAAAMEACCVVSTLSSFTLEDIQRESPASKWFQLYFQQQRETTLALVRRAEAAGYSALVVTLDTPLQPASLRAQCAGFALPADVRAENLAGYPAAPVVSLSSGSSRIFQGLMQAAPGYKDLHWLLANTTLPVLVKGVLHPDDARRFVELGASGVVVSNHGGRALDGVPASLDALPAIRQAVGNDITVLLDGGIRSGRDAFKAIASGANAVLLGRPQVHALAVAGALGVAHLLKLLRDDLETTMALAGCPTLAHITSDSLFNGAPSHNL
jgi:4-hydroxymandelate oxidase